MFAWDHHSSHHILFKIHSAHRYALERTVRPPLRRLTAGFPATGYGMNVTSSQAGSAVRCAGFCLLRPRMQGLFWLPLFFLLSQLEEDKQKVLVYKFTPGCPSDSL